MNDQDVKLPSGYELIAAESKSLGFSMCSDLQTGSLLRTLVSSKPGGRFLEIGTGTGLSLAFIVDGMDKNAMVTSIDNAEEFQEVAKNYFRQDERVDFFTGDGNDWIKEHREEKFDLIFADSWPGKYMLLDETLAMLKPGGFYVIDDMNEQPNWPEGHDIKAAALAETLKANAAYNTTVLNWSTGLIIVTAR
jgi:predicted O-methyltransferase YrrM